MDKTVEGQKKRVEWEEAERKEREVLTKYLEKADAVKAAREKADEAYEQYKKAVKALSLLLKKQALVAAALIERRAVLHPIRRPAVRPATTNWLAPGAGLAAGQAAVQRKA